MHRVDQQHCVCILPSEFCITESTLYQPLSIGLAGSAVMFTTAQW